MITELNYNYSVGNNALKITEVDTIFGKVPKVFDEFWTAKQRQMHSLHYVLSYRASFKPELPDFFIRRYSKEGDVIADPFAGRGTTILQAVLLGRTGYSNDINPLSERITYPKLHPVSVEEIEKRLDEIDLTATVDLSKEEDMSMFYHQDTYKEIINLRNYLRNHRDDIDRFIELIVLSRLHGHSIGFFSTYSFPQISIPKANQVKINRTRGVEPEYREIKSRIIKKAKTTLKDGKIEEIRKNSKTVKITTEDSRELKSWPSESVNLVVTSPPFLNQVDYITDTWIECWFCDIDTKELRKKVVQTADLDEWKQFISDTLNEMHRVLVPYGILAIEVGEVRYKGELLNLDEVIVELVNSKKYNFQQFRIKEIFIQTQEFTKLSNCFNVKNNILGTNTNRIVLMEKI